MSSPEERTRLGAAQGGDGAVAAAWQERQDRIAADVAQMAAGHSGLEEQTKHFGGRPSPAVQMVTHGQAAPSVPDEGGHSSASSKIC